MSIALPPAFARFEGLDIPPGKADYTLRDQFTLPVDAELVGVGSHAHYVGKPMKTKTRKELIAGLKPHHLQYLRADNGDLPEGYVTPAKPVRMTATVSLGSI